MRLAFNSRQSVIANVRYEYSRYILYSSLITQPKWMQFAAHYRSPRWWSRKRIVSQIPITLYHILATQGRWDTGCSDYCHAHALTLLYSLFYSRARCKWLLGAFDIFISCVFCFFIARDHRDRKTQLFFFF